MSECLAQNETTTTHPVRIFNHNISPTIFQIRLFNTNHHIYSLHIRSCILNANTNVYISSIPLQLTGICILYL